MIQLIELIEAYMPDQAKLIKKLINKQYFSHVLLIKPKSHKRGGLLQRSHEIF